MKTATRTATAQKESDIFKMLQDKMQEEHGESLDVNKMKTIRDFEHVKVIEYNNKESFYLYNVFTDLLLIVSRQDLEDFSKVGGSERQAEILRFIRNNTK